MADLVPEEAIAAAALASFHRVGSSATFNELPEVHRDGWYASAKAGLDAAAPLIVAAELDALAKQLRLSADALGSPAMDTPASGMRIVALDVADDLELRASVLRGEGDRTDG